MSYIVSPLSRKLNENLHVLVYIENVLIAAEIYLYFKNPIDFLCVRPTQSSVEKRTTWFSSL